MPAKATTGIGNAFVFQLAENLLGPATARVWKEWKIRTRFSKGYGGGRLAHDALLA